MTEIINGRKIRDIILAKIKSEVLSLPFKPIFTDVLVGGDPSSMQYVRMKADMAESVGMRFLHATFSHEITTDDLVNEIKELNNIEHMCGIIVQLPLPVSINTHKVLDAIDVSLDVDCLGSIANKKFYAGTHSLGMPTALAVMKVLENLPMSLHGKNIVVLGYGELVGRPVTAMLRMHGFSPEVLVRGTLNRVQLLKEADIIISGIGQSKYIKGDMIKKGAVLIDAGTSESDSGITGDVDFESVNGIASYVSPTPGGVGPVTVAMLLLNVLEVAKSLKQK